VAKKPETTPDSPVSQPSDASDQAAPAQRQQIQIDDSNAVATYGNFCRIMGTPEEVIVDFGLNPQPMGTPTEPIAVKQRIITNYYTAKRMLQALQMTVQRHEATFGVLEIDVRRRLRPEVAAQQPESASK